MNEQSDTLLQQLIFGENQCVSYRLLSRLLNINVNTAKSYLNSFYEKNQSLDASYILIGIEQINLDSSSEINEAENRDNAYVTHEPVTQKLSMRICNKDQLEASKSKFSPLKSFHIYSIAQSGSDDATNLSFVDLKTQELDINRPIEEASSVLGLLRNPEFTAEHLKKSRASGKLAINKSNKVSTTGPSTTGPSKATSAKPISKTEPTKPSASTNTRPPSIKNFFNTNNTTNASKQSVKQPEKPKKNAIEAMFARAKGPPKEPEEKVIIEDHNETNENEKHQEPIESEEEIKKRKENRKTLEKIFDEETDVKMDNDDSGAEDDMDKGSEPEDIDMEAQEAEEAEQSIENDKQNQQENQQQNQPEEELFPNAPPGRRRGRRKVQKRVTKVNSDGYLVTDWQDVYESFSEDEVVQKPESSSISTAEKIKPVTKTEIQSIPERNKPKKNKGQKNQTSLLSFFNK